MSVTFDSDLPSTNKQKLEPCTCSQMAEGWGDFYRGNHSDEIRANLKADANPKCMFCKGEGVEIVSDDSDRPSINLANRNAVVLFQILGIDFGEDGLVGEMTIPEARRCIMRAQSRDNIAQFVRPTEKSYGKPREISPGVYDIKPVRMYATGLTEEKLHEYIRRFAEFVVEVSQLGATKIFWG